MEDWRDGGFGLYVHWPFCQSKCPYCDFNSHVATSIDQHRWQKAYLAEIDRLSDETSGRVLGSVFFGGGTPSLMEPSLVAAVLDRIRSRWQMTNDAEITMEANPGSVEARRFREYRVAGINRVSLGIQALDDMHLRKLGRLHTSDEARAALEIARTSFDRVSFDLIYARQDQSLGEWREELSRALVMAVDHLSLYQLTIEDGTVFADRHARGGLRGLPDENLAADMFELTQEICDQAGFPAYEVSNHAIAGAESRHNLVYWRSGDWVGIGPGAHGRLTLDGQRWATEAPRAPGDWLARVERRLGGEVPRAAISSTEAAQEYLLMALRLSEGMDLRRYRRISGRDLSPEAVTDLKAHGLLWHIDQRIGATGAGRPLLNALVRALDQGGG